MAIAPLAVAPDAVFRKCRHSALIGSGLDVWLVSNGIRLISICSGGLLAVRAGLL